MAEGEKMSEEWENWLEQMTSWPSVNDLSQGIMIYAIPKLPHLLAEINGGRGLQCNWSEEEQIEAYKGITEFAKKAIAHLQE